MKVRWINAGESIGARRGQVVVCIPVYAGHELLVRCLESVFAHTPVSVPIMVFDDASPDERSQEYVRELDGAHDQRELFYLRREWNVGFPANVNGAFAAAASADVVVLNSDCEVAEGWLENLRAAGYENSRVATATALTNHGSIASVPDLRRPRASLPEPWSFDGAAAAVRLRSRRIRPRIPTAVGHCMYIRRTALELVGDFDLVFTPGYGEEVDFSQRCLLSGLCHVLADDVLVLHHGGGSFAVTGDSHLVQEAHERIIATRYPYYHDALRSLERTAGPLSRALNAARRALGGLTVTVDLRDLGDDGPAEETVRALLSALARSDDVRVAALTSDRASTAAASALAGIEGLAVRHEADLDRADERADVVHRLHGVSSIEQMVELARLGERVVLTCVGLWRYQNPAYSENFQAWEAHRTLTRQVTGLADRIIFFSEAARADALAEGLADPDQTHTLSPGADHLAGGQLEPRPVRAAGPLAGRRETILCLEPSFRHMNRIFALRVLEQLQLRHDWGGGLLLVGREVEHGSSFSEEQCHLLDNPRLAQATVVLPDVDRAERAWLFGQCRLLLHFPIADGLDLIPFEAASHGVPSLLAPGASLAELIGDPDSTVLPWDAHVSADRALALLRDGDRRRRNLAAAARAASGLTWKATAEALLGIYDDTYGTPSVRAAARDLAVHAGLGGFANDVLGPVGRGGGAQSPSTGRPETLAIRPVIGGPVARALELGSRAMRRGRGALSTAAHARGR